MNTFLRALVMPILAALATFSASAQSSKASLETARRAVRCSTVSDMAARNARTADARESSKTVARLLMKLAQTGATGPQTIEWLNDMEGDLKTADATALQGMVKDCKALIGEQSEFLERLSSMEK
jgi:hypothetical protein